MYSQLKNTLNALALSAGFLLLGYSLSSPPQLTTPLLATAEPSLSQTPPTATDALQANEASDETAPRSGTSFRRQLGMPFISFSPLLSRQGG